MDVTRARFGLGHPPAHRWGLTRRKVQLRPTSTRARLGVQVRLISKPSCYYFRLFLFCSIIRIITLLKHIISQLYQLFFLQFLDYYFILFQFLGNSYYINYFNTIISIIFIWFNYTYYINKNTIISLILIIFIISLISFDLYYINYFYLSLLCLL
jgi:hypothetical protein